MTVQRITRRNELGVQSFSFGGAPKKTSKYKQLMTVQRNAVAERLLRGETNLEPKTLALDFYEYHELMRVQRMTWINGLSS
jgi:hypothetical protein